MFFERVACFWAKIPSNWSLCMSMASCTIEYDRLHVFWLKFIPSVCMLIGEDGIQCGSLCVFGLEIIHLVISRVYESIASFHLNSSPFFGWCNILALTCQRNIPLEEGTSCTRIV